MQNKLVADIFDFFFSFLQINSHFLARNRQRGQRIRMADRNMKILRKQIRFAIFPIENFVIWKQNLQHFAHHQNLSYFVGMITQNLALIFWLQQKINIQFFISVKFPDQNFRIIIGKIFVKWHSLIFDFIKVVKRY